VQSADNAAEMFKLNFSANKNLEYKLRAGRVQIVTIYNIWNGGFKIYNLVQRGLYINSIISQIRRS
jgi:hypothetical protein